MHVGSQMLSSIIQKRQEGKGEADAWRAVPTHLISVRFVCSMAYLLAVLARDTACGTVLTGTLCHDAPVK